VDAAPHGLPVAGSIIPAGFLFLVLCRTLLAGAPLLPFAGFRPRGVIYIITQIDLPQGKKSGLIESRWSLRQIDGIAWCNFGEKKICWCGTTGAADYPRL